MPWKFTKPPWNRQSWYLYNVKNNISVPLAHLASLNLLFPYLTVVIGQTFFSNMFFFFLAEKSWCVPRNFLCLNADTVVWNAVTDIMTVKTSWLQLSRPGFFSWNNHWFSLSHFFSISWKQDNTFAASGEEWYKQILHDQRDRVSDLFRQDCLQIKRLLFKEGQSWLYQ